MIDIPVVVAGMKTRLSVAVCSKMSGNRLGSDLSLLGSDPIYVSEELVSDFESSKLTYKGYVRIGKGAYPNQPVALKFRQKRILQ